MYHRLVRPGPITSAAAALVLLAPASPSPPAHHGAARALPAIVFVSRRPPPAGAPPGTIPGLGPAGRALVTGGRLMLRAPDGTVSELLPARFTDVSRPSVSPDARRVAFAAVAPPDSGWRIWVTALARPAPVPATRDDPPGSMRFDDLDPCWLDDSTLCFASTRYPQVAQYGGGPVTNLFVTRLGGVPTRITAERNGAETPALDPRTGRIVFARWWHNRYLASGDPSGLTTDPARALPGDTVSLWHAMSIAADGSDERIACGDPALRIAAMCYAPAPGPDGSIVGVYAANAGLWPASGGAGIQRFPGGHAAARRLAGAIVDPGARAGYGSPSGLAPASACSPAALPDGRVLFAYDPGGRGDFGIWLIGADGGGEARVVDLPGTLELDPAPVVSRAPATHAPHLPPEPRADRPPETLDQALARPGRFRFTNVDVFAPPGSPPRADSARIRFYAALARPGAEGGDSAVLVREALVGPGGRVDEADLPADLPLFEQLVGPGGRVLRAAHGPAHVAGLNAGAPGAEVRCVGCHTGHSIRPVPGAGHP